MARLALYQHTEAFFVVEIVQADSCVGQWSCSWTFGTGYCDRYGCSAKASCMGMHMLCDHMAIYVLHQ